MKDEKWKFCRALNLKEEDMPQSIALGDYFIPASYLEKEIAASPVVYKRRGLGCEFWDEVSPDDHYSSEPTDTARLIAITPIARDTAESLLRDMIKYGDGGNGLTLEMHGYLDRARKLVGDK